MKGFEAATEIGSTVTNVKLLTVTMNYILSTLTVEEERQLIDASIGVPRYDDEISVTRINRWQQRVVHTEYAMDVRWFNRFQGKVSFYRRDRHGEYRPIDITDVHYVALSELRSKWFRVIGRGKVTRGMATMQNAHYSNTPSPKSSHYWIHGGGHTQPFEEDKPVE